MSGGMSQSSGVLTITGKWQNKALDCLVDIPEEISHSPMSGGVSQSSGVLTITGK